MGSGEWAYRLGVNVAGNGVLNTLQEVTPRVNRALGYSIPPVIPVKRDGEPVGESQGEKPVGGGVGTASYCPVSIKALGDAVWYEFPIDPLVSVSGGNEVVKRSVMKPRNGSGLRGTVKERWNAKDYTVTISGMLAGDGGYPMEHVRALRNFCEGDVVLDVKCELLEPLNITRIVVESIDLPFTKGMENQMFTIRAASDNIERSSLFVKEL